MKAVGVVFGMALGVALLGVLAAGGYWSFKLAGSWFNALEPQIAAIMAIASVVALLCALILAGGFKASRSHNSSQSVTGDRADVYEQLLVWWHGRLTTHVERKEADIGWELSHLEQRLALRGSAKVITAYANLRRLTRQEGAADAEIQLLWGKLVQEMRMDLGQTNWNLEGKDLLDVLRG